MSGFHARDLDSSDPGLWLVLGNKSTLVNVREGLWYQLKMIITLCVMIQVTADFFCIKPDRY